MRGGTRVVFERKPFRGTFTGSYTVNEDCSGTVLVDLGDGTIFHFDLVIQGSSRHASINTDPGVFMSVYSFQRISGEKPEPERGLDGA